MSNTNTAVAVVERVITMQNENMARVQKGLPGDSHRGSTNVAADDLGIKPWEKKSISYARCRAYINGRTYSLYKDNAAGAKNFKQAQKKIAIEFLGGKVEWEGIGQDKKKFVKFADGSQARY